jgi:hypothetical protein
VLKRRAVAKRRGRAAAHAAPDARPVEPAPDGGRENARRGRIPTGNSSREGRHREPAARNRCVFWLDVGNELPRQGPEGAGTAPASYPLPSHHPAVTAEPSGRDCGGLWRLGGGTLLPESVHRRPLSGACRPGRSFEEHPIEEPPEPKARTIRSRGWPRRSPPYRPPALMFRLEGCFRVRLNTACSAVPDTGFRPASDPDLRRRAGRRFYGRIGPDPRGVCSLARYVWCYTFSVMRGGRSGADGRGTSRRDSGPGGDRAMPAPACCLAMSAEALRRLCGGVRDESKRLSGAGAISPSKNRHLLAAGSTCRRTAIRALL